MLYIQWLCSQVLRQSATPVKRVVLPRISVPFNADNTATGGQFPSDKACDQASAQSIFPGILLPRLFWFPKRMGSFVQSSTSVHWAVAFSVPVSRWREWWALLWLFNQAIGLHPWIWQTRTSTCCSPLVLEVSALVVNGWIWQFQALLFGLSTTPLLCTPVLAPLSIQFHGRNILFHHYLYDLLIRGLTQSLCWSWTQTVLSLLYSLGLGVNCEKLEIVWSQDCVCGSSLSDPERNLPSSQPSLFCLSEHSQTLLDHPSAPAQFWVSLLGTLDSGEVSPSGSSSHLLDSLLPLPHKPQSLSTQLQRPWQTGLSWTLFTWWWNGTLSQSQLLPSVYQCIQQGVDTHEVLKADLHSSNCKGCWQAVSQSCFLFCAQWLGAK